MKHRSCNESRCAFIPESEYVVWRWTSHSKTRTAVCEPQGDRRFWRRCSGTGVKRKQRWPWRRLERESVRATSSGEGAATCGQFSKGTNAASLTTRLGDQGGEDRSTGSDKEWRPKIVVIGPPGSGKTTLTEQLRRVYGLVRVGCGDMLRAHVLYGTRLGRDAKPFMDTHELVPDEIVIPMVLERLRQRDCEEHGWVLDGFPRTVAQAQALQDFTAAARRRRDDTEPNNGGMRNLDLLGTIILLEASDERLVERVCHRRIDPETHTVYNLKFYPPEEEEVMERLLHIPADEPEAFRRRLAQFRATLPALLAYITQASNEVRGISDDGARLIRLDVSKPGVGERFLELEEQLWRKQGLRRRSEWREESIHEAVILPHASMSFARARAAGLLNRTNLVASPDWQDGAAQVTRNGDLVDFSKPPHEPVSADTKDGAKDLKSDTGSPSSSKPMSAKVQLSPGEGQSSVTNAATSASSSSARPGVERDAEERMREAADRAIESRTTTTQHLKASITLIRCDGVQCVRETVHHGDIAFHGSATEQVMLRWNERPRTVLLLVKKGAHLSDVAKQAVDYLQNVEMLQVLVEPWVQTELFALGTYVDSFHHTHELHHSVDLVICLGGDGLILYASTLFRTAVPPVAPFNLGSLGFLTPFEWKDFHGHMRTILSSDLMLSLRMRLLATVVRASGNAERQFHVLNEVVVDRGASPFLCQLECFWDDEPLASVQADGMIVASPTGSTAYSLAAGGAMVHPSVPAICVTPVCPHSLGLRPLVLPDSARIRVQVSPEARSHAWASFDGKHRLQLRRGDSLIVEMSKYPMPTVNATDHAADWFGSLIRGFGFSVRGAKPKPRPFGRSSSMERRSETDSDPMDK